MKTLKFYICLNKKEKGKDKQIKKKNKNFCLGKLKNTNKNLSLLSIEQQGFYYTFYKSDFNLESDNSFCVQIHFNICDYIVNY